MTKLKKIFSISVLIITTVLIILRFQSAIESFRPFVATLAPIFTDPHASYEEKMSMKYPVYFDFIQQLKNLTPDDSIIYFPQIDIPRGVPMWVAGQMKVDAALLFPRRVEFFQDQTADMKIPTYVVFIKGGPEGVIKSKDVYIIGKDVNILDGNYNSSSFQDGIGLIQL
jgi:hypothetical protein